jgi:hypothetical protein
MLAVYGGRREIVKPAGSADLIAWVAADTVSDTGPSNPVRAYPKPHGSFNPGV